MYSEEELLARLRRRDPEAFSYLFETYADKIYRVAVGVVRDEEEAEGVVQETFLRLFQRLEQFEGRSKLSTWLYRVAYNLSIDRVRKRRPQVSLDDDSGDEPLPAPVILADWRQAPEQQLSDAEVAEALDAAIAGLNEKYRTVFVLREVEGLSTVETAEVIGIKPGAVKVRLHRARLFLRERLSQTFAELV